ncbi:ABC transporter ATP-binding protein [Salinispira pacifica]|nr:ABC transporter ATP-binding protein [Salinispira pacifica]
MSTIIEMQNIRKEFPGIVANDDISLTLEQGEVHALLGENGAGKSTLMSILFGLYQPDKGRIMVRGKEVDIRNPTQANNLGIGMVHQHFKLVHNFTVTENIILGMEPMNGGVIDRKGAAEKIAKLSKHYGLNVDPHAKIEDISVGMQQRVEILKMLYRDAEVLIFDEPTAVLTPQEIRDLMKIMRNLLNEGKSIILITHKLKEIKEVADRCTVIRRGKVIGTVGVGETSEAEMARMMVGREVSFHVDKEEQKRGELTLSVKDLVVEGNRGDDAVKKFSFDLYNGEILGIAGVDGNGQTELVEALTGLRPVKSGTIDLDGVDITHKSIKGRFEAGLAHIPEDRQKRGLVLDYSIQENMILEIHEQEPYSRHGFLQFDEIRKHADKLIQEFDVRSGEGAIAKARALSGGNQQKAIVGREISHDPNLLIAVQPTRGLDVGSIEYIHKRLVEQRDSGKAVLLVSLELDEILDLADRIVVINHGQKVGEVITSETDENEVGLMMAGIEKGA